MDYFSVIKDSDIFDNPILEPAEYRARPTVKGFVCDSDGNIAFLWHPINHYGLLPGGGIEEGETPEEAFVRECKEEIGCEISILSKVGTAVQYRAKDGRMFEIHFYVANVIGDKGIPTTTQENELSVEIKWVTKEQLKEQLHNQTLLKHPEWYHTDQYHKPFNSHTHFAALKKYLGKE